jgi:hypothetical protein
MSPFLSEIIARAMLWLFSWSLQTWWCFRSAIHMVLIHIGRVWWVFIRDGTLWKWLGNWSVPLRVEGRGPSYLLCFVVCAVRSYTWHMEPPHNTQSNDSWWRAQISKTVSWSKPYFFTIDPFEYCITVTESWLISLLPKQWLSQYWAMTILLLLLINTYLDDGSVMSSSTRNHDWLSKNQRSL